MSVATDGVPSDRVAGSSGAASAAGAGRLLSLDALRGFDMFWIVGATAVVGAMEKLRPSRVTQVLATQLKHVDWQGFHAYDLIFPLFVFIAGVSMVFSMDKAMARHGRLSAVLRLGRRCVLLVLAGIFYYGGLSNRWPEIRLLGVLQYIGIACFVAGSVYIVLHRRPRAIAGVCATILVGYWAVMTFVPFPDLHLDKDSLAKTEKQVGSKDPKKVLATVKERVHGYYLEGYNLSNHIDYRYLPGKKIWGAYETQGLLTALGPIASCQLGILAGLWLRRADVGGGRKVLVLLAAGAAGLALGFAWGLQFPVVKKLWSSSFVLVAGGYSALLLGTFYMVVEVWGWRWWCGPLVWIGMNPITIYLAHNVLNFHDLAARFAGGDLQRYLDGRAKGAGSLLVALVELSLTFLLVRFLYVRKIFLRL